MQKGIENRGIQQYNVKRNPLGFRFVYEKLKNKDGKNNENVSAETVQGYEELLERAVG